MSTGLTAKQKLFVLRVVTSPTARAISDNSAELNADLDRGWQVGSYEVILADATLGLCHVLIRLTTTNATLPALPPDPPPATPVPPPSKLFVLRTNSGAVDARYNDQSFLANELDRGWILDCYEVVLSSPADASCFVLIKLTNPGTLPATPPGS
jgi:hypothetical protein